MGLFSKRRSKGFDPELWSDAAERGAGATDDAWFADLADGDDDPALDGLETNAGARFDEQDQAWLADDPGAEVRDRRR